MERTIRVTGKGTLALKPDQIRLSLTIEKTAPTYDLALALSEQSLNTLRNALSPIGFTKSSLKTTQFRINAHYESYKDKQGNWKNRFDGYALEHRLKLEFPADNALLAGVLCAIAGCGVDPEFRLEHTVADPESAKNELLARAVADSRAKAETLTRAAGVALGDLVTIDYSWGTVEFISHPLALPAPCAAPDCSANFELDMEPDDIDVSDTVTVIWSIH